MEIKDFAELILFTPDLTAKLSSPVHFTDENPGHPIDTPQSPARHSELSLYGDKSKKKFPTPSRLEEFKERGAVLHFFANHELLALELMALILLKFPDAPSKFRRGIVATMLEEQHHMKLYLTRMQDYGVQFGEIPVNSFFWDAMSKTSSPATFVAAMSLTLEQANLDYAKHYFEQFKKLGDTETSNILKKVYEDEIGHVGLGLTWLRQWKDPEISDWEAYSKLLTPPLSPSRARGIGFDRDGRIKAGLSTDFIDEIKLYRQSKGRPPVIFLFNPSAEEELNSSSKAYNEPTSLRAIRYDLETLMLFFAHDDDIVLVDKKPGKDFLTPLDQAGFAIPEFLVHGQVPNCQVANKFAPWAVTPTSIKQAQGLNLTWQCTLPKVAPPTIFSKSWAKELAQCFDQSEQGKIVTNIADVSVLKNLWSTKPIVLKANFSTSGRNRLKLNPGHELTVAELHWIEKRLKLEQSLVMEPWHHKLCDLSIQIEVFEKDVQVRGITRFKTDDRGRYRGHYLGAKWHDLDSNVMRTIHEKNFFKTLERCGELVGKALQSKGYLGPAGIDAMIVKDGENISLVPLVEINPRHTMGQVALKLDKRIFRGVDAGWFFIGQNEIKKMGLASFMEFKIWSEKNAKISVGDNNLISEGILFTTPPNTASGLLTCVAAGNAFHQLNIFWK